MVVSTVCVGGPFFTVDRTEPFSAISSAFLPGMGLSSGMGMVDSQLAGSAQALLTLGTARWAREMSDHREVAARVRRSSDRLVGLLGGEHSITVGAVTALAGSHPDISVLYLDAHTDLRDEYMGSRWGHASVARRLHAVCPLVKVGVRSLSLGERRFIRDNEIPVVFWPPANGNGQRLADAGRLREHRPGRAGPRPDAGRGDA